MDSNKKIFSEGISEISQENTGVLTIGNVELEIDATDPDFLENLEISGKELQEFSASGTEIEKTRALVAFMDQKFDFLFGKGTAAEAFPNKSLTKRINAWGAIVEIANEQKAALNSKMSLFTSKYNAGNRAQKRAAEKQKNHSYKGKKGKS